MKLIISGSFYKFNWKLKKKINFETYNSLTNEQEVKRNLAINTFRVNWWTLLSIDTWKKYECELFCEVWTCYLFSQHYIKIKMINRK